MNFQVKIFTFTFYGFLYRGSLFILDQKQIHKKMNYNILESFVIHFEEQIA